MEITGYLLTTTNTLVHGLIAFKRTDVLLKGGRASDLIWYQWAKSAKFQESLPKFPQYLFYLISGFLLRQGRGFVKRHRGGKYAFRFRKASFILVLYVAYLLKHAGYATGEVTQASGLTHFTVVTYYTIFFTELRNLWYRDGTFQVPEYVFTNFNPIIIAGWFMLSGKKSGNKIILSGGNISTEQLRKLRQTMNALYDLNALVKHSKIYISNLPVAVSLMEPFIHSSQYYRLLYKK